MKKVTKGLLLATIAMCSTAYADSLLIEDNVANIVAKIFSGEVKTEQEAMALVDTLEVTRDEADLKNEITNLSLALVEVMAEEDVKSAASKLELVLDNRNIFSSLYEQTQKVWEMLVNKLHELQAMIFGIEEGVVAAEPVVTPEAPAEVVVDEPVVEQEVIEEPAIEPIVVNEPATEELVAESVSAEAMPDTPTE